MPGVFTPVVSAGLVSQQISGAAAIILGTGGGTNAAPVWSTIPTVTFIEGTALTVPMSGYVHDPDMDVMTFSYNNVTRPPGVVYDALSNSFVYDGRTGAVSNYGGHILTANDGQGHSVPSASFSIQVVAPVSEFALDVQFFPAMPVNSGPGPGGKHMRYAYVPGTNRLFEFGGDYGAAPISLPGGGTADPSDSARQELWSCDPSVPNVWTLEYPYIGPTGDVQPRGPDESPIVWDSNRNLIWEITNSPFFAGLQPPDPDYTEGATALLGVFTFDPIGTKKWTQRVATLPLNNGLHFSQYVPDTDEIHSFLWIGSMAVHIINCANAMAGLPCETRVPMSTVGSNGSDRLWAEWSCFGYVDGRPKMWAVSFQGAGTGGNLIEWDCVARTSRVACAGLAEPELYTREMLDPSFPPPESWAADDPHPQEGHNQVLVWNPTIQRLERYFLGHDQPWVDPTIPGQYYPLCTNDLVGYVTALEIIDPRTGTFVTLDPLIPVPGATAANGSPAGYRRLRGNSVYHQPGVGTILLGGSGSNAVPTQPVVTHCSIINVVPTTPVAPGVPQNVTASTTFSDRIDVYWDAVASATGYNVYRSTTAGVTGSILTSVSNASVFSDTSAVVGTDYYYSIAATNTGGASLPSAQAHGLRTSGVVAPVITGFAANYSPDPLPFGGGSVTFIATIANTPTAVTLDGVDRLSSLTGTAFSFTTTVTLTKTFTLVASNSAGSTSANVTVTVDAGTPTGAWDTLTVTPFYRIMPAFQDPVTTNARTPALSANIPNKGFTTSIMGRDGMWYYFGGAHGDYPGNDVNACNLALISGNAMPWNDTAVPGSSWDRPHVPPNIAPYNGLYQGGGVSVWSAVTRDPAAYNWDSTTADPNWQPGSKHTYCNESWAPGFGLIVCGGITYPPYTTAGTGFQIMAWNMTDRWQAFPAQDSASPNLQGRFMLSEYDDSRNAILSFGIPSGSTPTLVHEWRLTDQKWYHIENVNQRLVVSGQSSSAGGSASVYLENGYHLIARLGNQATEATAALVLYKPGLTAKIFTIPAEIETYVGRQTDGTWLGARMPVAADRTNRIVYFAVTIDAVAPYKTFEIFQCGFDDLYATADGASPPLTQLIVTNQPVLPVTSAGAIDQSSSTDRRPMHYYGGYLWMMLHSSHTWETSANKFWRLNVG